MSRYRVSYGFANYAHHPAAPLLLKKSGVAPKRPPLAVMDCLVVGQAWLLIRRALELRVSRVCTMKSLLGSNLLDWQAFGELSKGGAAHQSLY